MVDQDSSFERLSPRMRECLRLVYHRRTTKEIAAVLGGLSPGTVDGYVAEAVRLLGARNRVDAAERLQAWEAATPSDLYPQSSGVSAVRLDQPDASDSGAGRRLPLPIRLQGATGNDLSILQRLGWILVLAIGIAVGIGGVANALRLASDVVRHG